MVAAVLKAPECEQRHKMPDVQAVGGRVKAAVERDGLHALTQRGRVRAIGDEAAPFQFLQDVHRRAK
jgi:hypothetical protein